MGPRYVTIWDGLSVLFSLFLHRGEGTWREDSKIERSERWIHLYSQVFLQTSTYLGGRRGGD